MFMQHQNQNLTQSLVFPLHPTKNDTILIQKLAVTGYAVNTWKMYQMWKKVIYSALVKFSLRSLMSHNHLSLDLHGRVNPAFSSPSPFLPYFSKLFDPKDLWALGRIPIKVLVTFCDPYIKFTLIASTNKLLKKRLYVTKWVTRWINILKNEAKWNR